MANAPKQHWTVIAATTGAHVHLALAAAEEIEANSIEGTGYPYRLIRAARQAMTKADHAAGASEAEFTSCMFDVIACLSGALALPVGDMTEPGREAVVATVSMLDELTHDLMSYPMLGPGDEESFVGPDGRACWLPPDRVAGGV